MTKKRGTSVKYFGLLAGVLLTLELFPCASGADPLDKWNMRVQVSNRRI